MIPQLAYRLAGGTATVKPTDAALADATEDVLSADPLDLVLHADQLWELATPRPPSVTAGLPADGIRRHLVVNNRFLAFPPPTPGRGWDHFGYSFCIDNSRAPQILLRVLQGYRSGEGLGIPSAATQRWLDATEVLLAGAINPMAAWLSTSAVRPSAEAVRRNAYWRMFNMDLSFGTDANAPFVYDKAEASNRSFPQLFEELLFELWRAIENLKNLVGANATDNDRIFRLAEQLSYILRTRRQNGVLDREELSASLAMGWVELTLASNTPVVRDLRADATSPGDRLRIIGERVGLAPHSKAGAFLSMANELSLVLRTLEANLLQGANDAPILYSPTKPAIGEESLRVLTEWSAATGRDLKARKAAVPTQQQNGRAQLVGR
jgi:hypothetical protein